MFYRKKGGSFWTEKCVLSRKRGCFELKSQYFAAKKGSNFQTGEQGWVPLFPMSEGAWVLTGQDCITCLSCILRWSTFPLKKPVDNSEKFRK